MYRSQKKICYIVIFWIFWLLKFSQMRVKYKKGSKDLKVFFFSKENDNCPPFSIKKIKSRLKDKNSYFDKIFRTTTDLHVFLS